MAACSGDDPAPRTRAQFCADWAAAACSDEVVSACQAEDVESCRVAQEAFCEELVPASFSDTAGSACIRAVRRAYADADLDGEELGVVLRLAEPCDGIIAGPGEEGDSCEEPRDCNLAAGLECLKKSDSTEGVCRMPEVVMAGLDCEAEQKTCEEGFFCNGSNCVEARDPGDECTIQAECGEEGFCNAEGECEESYAVGEACETDMQCGTGICYEFEDETVCTDLIRLSRSEPVCDDLR